MRSSARWPPSRARNGGLVVTGSAQAAVHSNLIVTLAARHKLPAVYFGRFVVTAGGLISYGPDFIDEHRRVGQGSLRLSELLYQTALHHWQGATDHALGA
jgi:hypothetical protein